VVSKTHNFCPSEAKVVRFQASLSSPSERNHARSALKRFFHPLAFAKQKILDLAWQKQRVLEPYCLSLSFKVASSIPQMPLRYDKLPPYHGE